MTAYEEAIRRGNTSPDTQLYLAAVYAYAGEREKALAILRQLEARKIHFSPEALADFYIALGEREKAFASLERAYAEHDNQLMFLRVDPYLNPI